jgi:hypothetical protein
MNDKKKASNEEAAKALNLPLHTVAALRKPFHYFGAVAFAFCAGNWAAYHIIPAIHAAQIAAAS